MNTYTLLFSLLITQILSQSLCGMVDGVCLTHDCCICSQHPNQDNGNGYLEFNAGCQLNGGLHCVANTGCNLCWKPTFGAINVGDRPICDRFRLLSATCNDENCCLLAQLGNPTNGNGYLEFDADCLLNGGGLHCVHNSGCRLCYKPTTGSVNVGDRPICRRYANQAPAPFTFPPVCTSEQCCIDAQNPNHDDGNGFLEFNADCKINGGLHCVHNGGCRLCYKPVVGGVNVGNRPICTRFRNLLPICSDNNCCLDIQNANLADGNGFLEFDLTCKLNGGGVHCVHNTGCRMCYKPVLGGVNIGDRPICTRYLVNNFNVDL